jgi:spore coat protein U-like protein
MSRAGHWGPWLMAALSLGTAGRAEAASCTLASTSLSFGSYAITVPALATATVTVRCTKQAGHTTLAYEVELTPAGGGFRERTLAAGSETLSYAIYRDPANTQVWGTGTPPTTVNTGIFDFGGLAIGSALTQTFTAYGSISAASAGEDNDRPPGTYTRNVTVRLRRLRPGSAASLATATMAASATINPACSVVTNGSLAFGAYDPTSAAPLDAAGAVQFRCTATSTFDIGIGGTAGARRMSGPDGETLGYELYSDAARTNTWGNAQDADTVAADDAADGSGNGLSTLRAAQARTVYGRVPAGQVKAAGNYSDTLTITVYY